MELSKRSIKKIDQIVKGASREFIKYGYTKTSIDGISRSTGVSKMTIYKYFENKQDLYEHILKEIYLEEFKEIKETIHSTLSFKEKIDKIVFVRLRKYDDANTLKVERTYIMSDKLKVFFDEHVKYMKDLNHTLYEQGKQEGLIRPDITDKMLEQYFNIIRSGLRTNFIAIRDLSTEERSSLLEILYAGVLGCQFTK